MTIISSSFGHLSQNNDTNIIRIGTRTSNLALTQVAEVHLLIADHYPKIKIEIIPITTSGDKIKDRNLAEFGGKGLFIKELEEALLENKIDIAIHSAKDVPPIIDQATEICAFTQRLDPRDCLISKKFSSIDKLPKNAVIGTSSPRRAALILRQRRDLKIVNFRGNVDTRLRKVFDDEIVDATILAVSGLERLAKNQLIKSPLSLEEMPPSGGQGALAIQVRKNDQKIIEIISKINHCDTQICIKSERSFLRELGASCTTPVSVYAEIKNKKLYLKTMIIDYDGKSFYETSGSCKVNLEEAVKLGEKLALQTKKQSSDLLARIVK
jgi:hydroxymethylbilane synthase